jgi:hypothetical protein
MTAPEVTDAISQAADERPLVVSFFASVTDTQPRVIEVGWEEELAPWLQQHKEIEVREAARLWSPASYLPGATRENASVEFLDLLVLDFDKITVADLDAIRARLKGYAYVIHTTWRHTPEKPRVRVVMPLVAPIAAADWPDI